VVTILYMIVPFTLDIQWNTWTTFKHFHARCFFCVIFVLFFIIKFSCLRFQNC